MDKEMHFCQSCGMPLTDEIHGTNADGSKNEEYCIYCFKDGAFTGDFTMEEMIDFCSQFVEQYNKDRYMRRRQRPCLMNGSTLWRFQPHQPTCIFSSVCVSSFLIVPCLRLIRQHTTITRPCPKTFIAISYVLWEKKWSQEA